MYGKTSFTSVYDSFLSKVVDDMYLELTELDTYRMLEELLMSAIHKFEFPRVDLTDFERYEVIDEYTYCGVDSDNQEVTAILYDTGAFNNQLTDEEINIISIYMVVEWLGQQLATIENTRMKFSGADFKFTSQANHMQKILQLKKDYEREGFHMQRLYKRRLRNNAGIPKTTMESIMANSVRGGQL